MNRAVRFGVCVLLAAGIASAAEQKSQPATVRIEFSDVTLANGLRVQLVEDHGAPASPTCSST
jgi:zinc protease